MCCITGFFNLILLLSFPPGLFGALYFSCLPDGKEIGSDTSTQVRMSNGDVLKGLGKAGKLFLAHESCWQLLMPHCPCPAFAATVTKN